MALLFWDSVLTFSMQQPRLVAKTALSLEAAKWMANAAEAAATSLRIPVVIAIVDDGGNLLYLQRMDGAPIGSVEVAIRKARSAVFFRTETKNFETGLSSGATGLLSLDLVPFEGGIPALLQREIAGGIGVSGGTASQDGTVARAGIAVLASSSKEVAKA
jgi:glc operon protein GlcG